MDKILFYMNESALLRRTIEGLKVDLTNKELSLRAERETRVQAEIDLKAVRAKLSDTEERMASERLYLTSVERQRDLCLGWIAAKESKHPMADEMREYLNNHRDQFLYSNRPDSSKRRY